MVSYRGILAAIIGLVFLAFSVFPDRFFADAMPWVLRGIVFVCGALLLWMGAALQRQVFRAYRIVKTQTAVPGEVIVFPESDAESGARTLHVKTNGACFALAVDVSGMPGPALDDGKVRACEVHMDPTSGKVAAISVDGNPLNLILGSTRLGQNQFGRT